MPSFHPATARLAGRALLLARERIQGLLALPFEDDGAWPVAARPAPFTVRNGIAVVPILGPMVSRGDWLSELLGAPSYAEIGDAIEAAFMDPASRAVVLEIDTPGGEVGGLFDLVERIASLRATTGKPLWAVASEAALSAGFAIASAAERLYVTQTGEVGSVGVVAVHIDASAADAMAGLEWTLIHAGAKKTDGNAHEPLPDRVRADIQADVDAIYDRFVALVARNRGLAPDAVRATEAAIYRGRRGVAIGFADRIGTVEQALADLASELDAARAATNAPRRALNRQPRRRKPDMTIDTISDGPAGSAPADEPDRPETERPETLELTPAAAPAVAVSAPLSPTPAPDPGRAPPADAPAAPAASADTGALRAEFAEIASVAAQAARLGVPVDAAEAMRQGVKPDALRRSVLDALAARTEASAVVAVAPATAGDSPIVRRARERAAASRN